jgi:hypothetical protein
VTRWEVVADGARWAVVKVREGRAPEGRARWSGISCVAARCLAAELNSAYELGREEYASSIYPYCFRRLNIPISLGAGPGLGIFCCASIPR